MKEIVDELQQIVEAYSKKIKGISEDEFSRKPLPNKWSRKEVLGHLIDSGQNNLRRFTCAQYETKPSKIAYDQDFWVKAGNYQNQPSADVIEFWIAINRQICATLRAMPKENYSKVSNVGKLEVKLLSIEFLADDYVRHLKHHLNQIIPGSFDIVYV
ncbi:MAG: DinB family protein [Bacteroidota bacterium]